jgi:hypothetical protein
MSAPAATIKSYRRTGGAVVTVERQGRSPHRYQVSLRRYHSLREWAVVRWAGTPGTSGAWLRSSFTVSLWTKGGDAPTHG